MARCQGLAIATMTKELQSIMDEIHERREECDKLARELEIQRQHFKQELEYLGGQLREEAIR